MICAEAGKPLKTARVEAERAVSTLHVRGGRGPPARGRGRCRWTPRPPGEGKLAFTLRRPIGDRRRDQPVQLPAQPRRPQGRARRSPPAARSCSSPRPRRRSRRSSSPSSLEEAGLPAGLAQRRRRPRGRDRRRAGRGRARQARHVHRLGRGRLGPRAPRGAQAREARARERDAGDRRRDAPTRPRPRRGSRRTRSRSPGQSCISVQRIYVLARLVRRLRRAARRRDRDARRRRPGRRAHRRRPGDRRRRARSDPRVDRRVAAARCSPAATTTADGLIRPTSDRATRRPTRRSSATEVFGPVCTVSPVASLDEAIERANATRVRPAGRRSSPSGCATALDAARAARVRRRGRERGADVPRRPDAVRRRRRPPATRRRARRGPSAR